MNNNSQQQNNVLSQQEKQNYAQQNQQQMNDENVIIKEEKCDKEGTNIEYDKQNIKKDDYFFADEVKVDGQTIFTIPIENQFEDQQKPTRISRWGERAERKKKIQQNVIFNPLEMYMNGQPLLPIMPESYKPGTTILNPNQISTVAEEKKQSKWGPEYEKTFHPPLLHQIPYGFSLDDIEYVIRLYRLDELNNRQNYMTESILDDEDCRSPSPEPQYDAQGKRTNTRENRLKESLQREKNNLIEECMKIKKSFVPPNDYKPPKKSKKIYLPENALHSDTNYMGKIIGPRGMTQKKLEQATGCKISIRGKGSSRSKKLEIDSDDKLHILIQAEIEENLDKGVAEIEKILKGEQDEELKKTQMLQLQVVQGIVTSEICDNCHEKGHRSWACPNKPTVKCEICGEKSHIANDCPQKKNQTNNQNQPVAKSQETLEQEFSRFVQDVEGGNASKLINLASAQQTNINPQQKARAPIQTHFITDQINPQMLSITETGVETSIFQAQSKMDVDPSLTLQMDKVKEDINNKVQGQQQLDQSQPQAALNSQDQLQQQMVQQNAAFLQQQQMYMQQQGYIQQAQYIPMQYNYGYQMVNPLYGQYIQPQWNSAMMQTPYINQMVPMQNVQMQQGQYQVQPQQQNQFNQMPNQPGMNQ